MAHPNRLSTVSLIIEKNVVVDIFTNKWNLAAVRKPAFLSLLTRKTGLCAPPPPILASQIIF